ncbi:Pre-mRNA-splicing factor of RES complex-domain-containing protein [Halteromyces radiatus]|uniref:Pre-mRNA-splicing factor of RES complex-domain-containing protein n=1 Tax=Halteromyces radiatus TaxID=101107 RepID=UPI00222007FB|nr:Pre-mRNA-splicing factor of RES complex-domain-containing protein [Halteromyces radiatus]KAI8077850.1 Pre-mRNA-splicing factor of RES complex-domain-containing protein [Halteromyces radiatus]
MSSGQKAGLLTSKEIQEEAARARQLEQRAMERLAEERRKNNDDDDGEETIYRDSSGRKVDPKLAKAEQARQRKLEIERQERKMEWGKGLVQRNEQDRRRRQLEEEAHKPMARYADDVEYNQGLRDEDRWNDPAAGFLTKKSSTSTGKGKQMVRPKYKGGWKPNRFMIPPGYRWDGVDRSNGYEDQFLLQQNSRKSLAAEAHAWSTEDM